MLAREAAMSVVLAKVNMMILGKLLFGQEKLYEGKHMKLHLLSMMTLTYHSHVYRTDLQVQGKISNL